MEDKREDELRRGSQAQALLNDDLLKEAFNILKDRFTEEWAASKPNETLRREDAWRMVKVVNKVQGYLNEILATGKLSSAKVTKLNKNPLFRR